MKPTHLPHSSIFISSRPAQTFVRLTTAVIMTAGLMLAQTAGTGNQSDRDQRRAEEPQSEGVRRLESVSWNPVSGELTWIVSKGKTASEMTDKDTYVIRIDEAQMKFEGERRGFNPEEARSVHRLLNVLSRYAVESTIWWEQGRGIKLDERGRKPGLRAQADLSAEKDRAASEPQSTTVKPVPTAVARD